MALNRSLLRLSDHQGHSSPCFFRIFISLSLEWVLPVWMPSSYLSCAKRERSLRLAGYSRRSKSKLVSYARLWNPLGGKRSVEDLTTPTLINLYMTLDAIWMTCWRRYQAEMVGRNELGDSEKNVNLVIESWDVRLGCNGYQFGMRYRTAEFQLGLLHSLTRKSCVMHKKKYDLIWTLMTRNSTEILTVFPLAVFLLIWNT